MDSETQRIRDRRRMGLEQEICLWKSLELNSSSEDQRIDCKKCNGYYKECDKYVPIKRKYMGLK